MNNRIFRTFILFAFISFGLLNNAHAQVNFQNLSSVNVDNLTDQQIKKLIQDAQNAGLSDADLLQQARSRGVSPIQIQKLQDRVRDIRSKNPSSNSADTTIDGRRRPNYKEDKDSADSSATQAGYL